MIPPIGPGGKPLDVGSVSRAATIAPRRQSLIDVGIQEQNNPILHLVGGGYF